MDIKALVNKLSNWYWSPELPSTYVIQHEGRDIGIGKIAFSCPGAFNLAWASCEGRWATKEDQERLVTSFSRFRTLETVDIDGQDVLTWACMLPMYEYGEFILSSKLSRECKARILTSKFGLVK